MFVESIVGGVLNLIGEVKFRFEYALNYDRLVENGVQRSLLELSYSGGRNYALALKHESFKTSNLTAHGLQLTFDYHF